MHTQMHTFYKQWETEKFIDVGTSYKSFLLYTTHDIELMQALFVQGLQNIVFNFSQLVGELSKT